MRLKISRIDPKHAPSSLSSPSKKKHKTIGNQPSTAVYTVSTLALPALDLIKCEHIAGRVHALQEIKAVPSSTVDILAAPRAKINPISAVSLELRGIHDRSYLSRRNDFGVISECQQVVVGRRDGLRCSVSIPQTREREKEREREGGEREKKRRRTP